jgi:hypothetical protein
MKTVKHHAIGRSLKKDYNTEDPRNLIEMCEKRERGLHALFGTLLTPHEQFEYINGLWLPIQSKLIRELVEIINECPKHERYADGLVRK